MLKHSDFDPKKDFYSLFSDYMEKIAQELGYETCRFKNNIFTAGGVTFNKTTFAPIAAWIKIKNKNFIRKFISEMPTKITEPCRGMVIKPVDGSLGIGVKIGDYIPIPDGYIAEEYVSGDAYRVLVLKGKVVAAVKEKKPFVIGDGKKTVNELLANYKPYPNQLWLPKLVDKKQADYIPAKDEIFETHYLHNIRYGGFREDITNKLPMEVKKLALKAFSKVENICVAGIDIIHNTTTGRVYLLEMNSAPGVYSHYFPYKGKSRDVLRMIVEEALLNKPKNENDV